MKRLQWLPAEARTHVNSPSSGDRRRGPQDSCCLSSPVSSRSSALGRCSPPSPALQGCERLPHFPAHASLPGTLTSRSSRDRLLLTLPAWGSASDGPLRTAGRGGDLLGARRPPSLPGLHRTYTIYACLYHVCVSLLLVTPCFSRCVEAVGERGRICSCCPFLGSIWVRTGIRNVCHTEPRKGSPGREWALAGGEQDRAPPATVTDKTRGFVLLKCPWRLDSSQGLSGRAMKRSGDCLWLCFPHLSEGRGSSEPASLCKMPWDENSKV